MSNLVSRLRKNVWKTPGFKQLRQSPRINALLGTGYGTHWGLFTSSQEAQEYLRASIRSTYNNDAIVKFNIDQYYGIKIYDWPVLFFLQDLLTRNELRTVTDFGGHVGVKFYAYRELLGFPADFQWQVFDLPAMIAEGRRRLPPEEHALRFFDDLESTRPSDVMIFSGVLQYLDSSIQEMLDRLPSRPSMIILNKVAVHDTESFYTLENYGNHWLAYHVVTLKDLEESRTALGYELVSSWTVPREITVNSARGRRTVRTIGQVWRRSATAAG